MWCVADRFCYGRIRSAICRMNSKAQITCYCTPGPSSYLEIGVSISVNIIQDNFQLPNVINYNPKHAHLQNVCVCVCVYVLVYSKQEVCTCQLPWI